MRKITRILFVLVIVLSFVGNTAFASNQHRGGPRAVTMWWVIFNSPDNCVGNPGGLEQCTSVDVFGQAYLDSVANGTPDPALIAPTLDSKPAVLFATGGKTGNAGRIMLTASIYRDTPGKRLKLPPGVDPMGFGRSLESEDAEIHLVIRDHGRADRDLLPQITNFLDPYCSDPNLLYFGGKNICADVQFAIFGARESGVDRVYKFAKPTRPIRRANAALLRDGDSVRAVVETVIKKSR